MKQEFECNCGLGILVETEGDICDVCKIEQAEQAAVESNEW